MPAQIRWDPGDSAGERTLAPWSDVARWNRWKVMPATIGERATAVGDGRMYQWSHRTDYGASAILPHIHISDQPLVQEFLLWANAGGEFAIDTGDTDDNSYDECQVAPGTLAECSEPDPETLDLTLTLAWIQVAAVPVPQTCIYN